MSQELAEKFVEAGFQELMSADPSGKWVKLVNLNHLNIASMHACVLGYVYGDYKRGVIALNPELDPLFHADGDAARETIVSWAISRGFGLGHEATAAELNVAWFMKLESLQA